MMNNFEMNDEMLEQVNGGFSWDDFNKFWKEVDRLTPGLEDLIKRFL